MRISTLIGLSACFIFMMGRNALFMKNDAEALKAYNRVCATLPNPHPDCPSSRPVK